MISLKIPIVNIGLNPPPKRICPNLLFPLFSQKITDRRPENSQMRDSTQWGPLLHTCCCDVTLACTTQRRTSLLFSVWRQSLEQIWGVCVGPGLVVKHLRLFDLRLVVALTLKTAVTQKYKFLDEEPEALVV